VRRIGGRQRAGDSADAAMFLAGDESAYMTAADVVVDGGLING
jgi:NAD(P)-dependent dehydrogenase (short-subunit alcohol dehydrogenase family)